MVPNGALSDLENQDTLMIRTLFVGPKVYQCTDSTVLTSLSILEADIAI